MRILYSAILFFYQTIIRIAAVTGNSKAKQWIYGRKNWEKKLKESLTDNKGKRIWIHCASLGEFEQGRPLIERIKKEQPETSIILSFFSPSGYEVRKNYQMADVVCYLPLDSRKNAQRFIEIISPTLAIFIKYEFWYYYFNELGRKKIPLYLASAIFRPGQIFFKPLGTIFRKALKNVSHFFVQDERSLKLLRSIGFTNGTVTGDTRFDRVFEITSELKPVELISKFKNDRKIIVAGSTWKEDEELLLEALKFFKTENFPVIIAPHEVNEKRISEIIKSIKRFFPSAGIATYSGGKCNGTESFFILDTIGQLSSTYSYGTIAWIGGGFGKGIHNILEAAAFGNPVLFGPNHERFKEAVELSKLKGAFPVKTASEAYENLSHLLKDPALYNLASKTAADFVASNRGATEKILRHAGLVA